MPTRPVTIEFVKGATRRYAALLHRPDGVDVRFEGGSYNKIGGHPGDVPHDIAHLIVEDELVLRQGVWGVLVAGGMFRHATVVNGRQAPHAAERGRALVEGANVEIMQAELLTRLICDVCCGTVPADVPALHHAVGHHGSTDALTDAALTRARARLRDASLRWAALAPHETVTMTWPHAPVDPRPGRGRRRR